MARSFDIDTESAASVDQVFAAFGREDYWRARLAAFDAASVLDSLTVDDDGAVDVSVTQYLGRSVLPGAVAKLIPGDLKFVHTETWRRVGEQRVEGRVDVAVPAGLGNGHADAVMVPDGTGSRLRFAASCQVKIPLLGRTFERTVATDLTKNIKELQRFTTTWISEMSGSF